ncbi:MAG: hypothetical protein GTO14_11220 [Anaerolineales bacterium]|nr:hypothetical protein [Anaerolineales bacterium]
MKREKPFEGQSPYMKMELARKKRLMIGLINTFMIITPILLLFLGLLSASRISVHTIIVIVLVACFLPISFFARLLAQRGKVVLSSYALIVPCMIIVAINGTIISGFSPVISISYAIAIIISGMVIGPRHGYVIAGIGAVLWAISTIIQASSAIPILTVSGLFPQAVVIGVYALALIFVAALSRLATQDLRQSLDEATYDLVEANSKLALASEMKSQFTARTSHELRTPLSSIITFTELAMREAYGPVEPKLGEKLQHVLNSAHHLRDIINDLLDLAKIEAGELEITEEIFTAQNLLETVQTTLEETVSQKGINLNVNLSPEMPMEIVGDEGRLKQILLNLASNAVKFTDEGGVDVTIELADQARWRMRVRDTGPGIPEDRFEAIFEEYRQLDDGIRDAEKKGTGLGLAITRNLVEMMGGEIHLESELGEGTTFEVLLPLKTPEYQAVPG